MKNVLFIIPSLALGGAQKEIVDLVNNINSDEFRLFLFTFEPQSTLLEYVNRKKVKFYNLPRRHKFDLAPAKTIAEIIRKENIDTIYCSLQIAFLYGFLGRLLAKSKAALFLSIHTTINWGFKEEFFDRFLYAPLMRHCYKIITVCENQNKHWSSKFPFLKEKIVTIHNGIDTEKFKDDISKGEKDKLKQSLGIKEGETIIGIIAGLRPEKGHEYAFKAIRALLDKGRKVRLVLVGAGQRRRRLESLAEKLRLSGHIVWLGFQKDIKPYLSLFDIFLLPSISVETFSVSILEALSMGKAVIATDIGGASEQISDGLNGFLIKPKDFKCIAENINFLIENPQVAEKFSKNSRPLVVNKFNLKEMIRKTERCLNCES